MMRKLLTAAAAALLTLAMSTTAFAGWVHEDGGDRYYIKKGVYLTSQYTEDGYWVDVNGYWDGKESIGWQNTDGEYVQLVDPLAGYQILGERIFKVTGVVGDGENRYWTTTVDVYDTAFMTNDEIKEIRKGDVLTLPGLDYELTAVNKASRDRIVSSNNSTDDSREKHTSSSTYKVRLQDAAGNQYILSPSRLRKISNGAKETETILRPVATGITITVPTWRDANRVNGTSHYTTTKNLIAKKMFFTAELKGDEVVSITDTIYNYDTVNTPVYSEDAAHGHLYNIKEY